MQYKQGILARREGSADMIELLIKVACFVKTNMLVISKAADLN